MQNLPNEPSDDDVREAVEEMVLCQCPEPQVIRLQDFGRENLIVPICEDCGNVMDAGKFEAIAAKKRESRLRFEVKQNKRTKQWRWKLLAKNNKSIAVSGESYHNKADCLDAVELVRAAAMAEVREVEG